VLVGALLLILVSLGVYAGFDGASHASGRNRDRSVAAALAQQDQERLRAMNPTSLAGYVNNPSSRTVTSGGGTYTVTSRANYANDSASAPSCTSAAPASSYLKISSTVIAARSGNGPVTVASLVSPRDSQGGAAVQVSGASGTGVSGVTVSLDQTGLTDVTDANGCVQFGILDNTTSYTYSASAPGFVDPSGNTAISAKPLTVTSGSTSITPVTYDLGGTIQASFKDPTGTIAVNGMGLTVQNTNATNPNPQRFFTQATAATTQTTPALYPFSGTSSIWAGACPAAKPLTPPTVTVTRGSAPVAIVTEWPLTVTVQRRTANFGSGSTYVPFAGADVKVTDACNTTYPNLPPTDPNGQTTGYFPSGTVTICADDNQATLATTRKVTSTVAMPTSGTATTTKLLQINAYSGGTPSGQQC
jgi:hypothetical protein